MHFSVAVFKLSLPLITTLWIFCCWIQLTIILDSYCFSQLLKVVFFLKKISLSLRESLSRSLSLMSLLQAVVLICYWLGLTLLLLNTSFSVSTVMYMYMYTYVHVLSIVLLLIFYFVTEQALVHTCIINFCCWSHEMLSCVNLPVQNSGTELKVIFNLWLMWSISKITHAMHSEVKAVFIGWRYYFVSINLFPFVLHTKLMPHSVWALRKKWYTSCTKCTKFNCSLLPECNNHSAAQLGWSLHNSEGCC